MRGRQRSSAPQRRVLAAALLALVALSLPATPASAQVEGLRVAATTTYRLDPAAGLVHTTVAADLTNTMPTRRRGIYLETPYFDSFVVPALGPVANPRASSGGRALPVDVEVTPEGITTVTIDLQPNLVHGSPQSIVVEYDLPGQPSRSPEITRVNEAFANWFVYGVGDPGSIDIVIDVPEDFDVTLSPGTAIATSQADGRRVYRAEDIPRVEDAALFATARDDDRLDERSLSIGENDITVRAWPTDPEWADFAVATFERGAAALIELTGLDLPQRDLTVIESTASYHLGYAGFYDASSGTIEVGDELDAQLLLHELSHVWFNREMFADRWIYEGLAEDLARRAAEQLEMPAQGPDAIDRGAPEAIALNDWTTATTPDVTASPIDAFAYNASHAVVRDLVEQIGVETLREVLDAAAQDHIAYRGDHEPERSPVNDWRYLYDLVDLAEGSDAIAELFRTHVLTPEQAGELEARGEARAALDELIAAAGGWTAPLQVRGLMSRWQFGAARDHISRTHEVLGRIDALSGSLRELDVDVSGALEPVYETARTVEGLEEDVQGFEEVGAALLSEHQRRGDAGPIATLGLVATQPDLGAAIASYEDGDLNQAREHLDAAARVTDRAPVRGAALLAAILLLATTGGAHLVVVRQHRRTMLTGRAGSAVSSRFP